MKDFFPGEKHLLRIEIRMMIKTNETVIKRI